MKPNRELRLFLAEDSTPVRRAIQSLIADIPGIALAGCAYNAQQALEEITRLQPDIVVLDIHMPNGSGLNILDGVQRGPQPPPVTIVFSTQSDEASQRECRRRGAKYFFDKSMEIDQFIETLRSLVASGA